MGSLETTASTRMRKLRAVRPVRQPTARRRKRCRRLTSRPRCACCADGPVFRERQGRVVVAYRRRARVAVLQLAELQHRILRVQLEGGLRERVGRGPMDSRARAGDGYGVLRGPRRSRSRRRVLKRRALRPPPAHLSKTFCCRGEPASTTRTTEGSAPRPGVDPIFSGGGPPSRSGVARSAWPSRR